MSVAVFLTESAREEIRQARRWYSQVDRRLGRDFARSIRASLDRISEFPHGHPATDRGARKALVRRFPYVIVYEIETNRVAVLACFHARRNRLT